jgi:hypothetical protein
LTNNTTMRSVVFLATIIATLLALVQAGTRPEDLKWLEAKATEPGVIATGTGLLYKGEFCILLFSSCWLAVRMVHMFCKAIKFLTVSVRGCCFRDYAGHGQDSDD